jgi:hypothetical protein
MIRDKYRIMRKLSTESFIQKARTKHGEKYDYSRVSYTASHCPIEIGCPMHGWFIQKAYQHLCYGCRKCGDERGAQHRRTSTEDFVIDAVAKHGQRYLYNKVIFSTQHDLVEIICPIHGSFRQAANDHLKGRGCKRCGIEKRSDARRGVPFMTTEQFIEKAKHIHQDIYDYGKTQNVISGKKVTIICPSHGDFLQLPNNHLAGNGCRACAMERKLVQFEEFRTRAKKIHGDQYQYDRLHYSRITESVGITCSRHGLFWQNGIDHTFSEAGCPSCAIEDKTKSQNKWLDMLKIDQREVWLTIDGRQIKADGYDPITKTIYEFWGDFWHGNPEVFDLEMINPMTKTTYRVLYEKTLNKRRLITNNGFNLIEIWENDWKRINGKSTSR